MPHSFKLKIEILNKGVLKLTNANSKFPNSPSLQLTPLKPYLHSCLTGLTTGTVLVITVELVVVLIVVVEVGEVLGKLELVVVVDGTVVGIVKYGVIGLGGGGGGPVVVLVAASDCVSEVVGVLMLELNVIISSGNEFKFVLLTADDSVVFTSQFKHRSVVV
jgi:hypothetical protein